MNLVRQHGICAGIEGQSKYKNFSPFYQNLPAFSPKEHLVGFGRNARFLIARFPNIDPAISLKYLINKSLEQGIIYPKRTIQRVAREFGISSRNLDCASVYKSDNFSHFKPSFLKKGLMLRRCQSEVLNE